MYNVSAVASFPALGTSSTSGITQGPTGSVSRIPDQLDSNSTTDHQPATALETSFEAGNGAFSPVP
jgi:hypothetical protein